MANYIKGLGEIGLEALTGAVAQPVSGWGGILAATQGKGVTKDQIDASQKNLTYAPRSQEAKDIKEGAGDFANWAWDKVPNPVQEAIKAVPQKYNQASDYVGETSPLLGTAMKTAPAAAAMAIPYGNRISKMDFESIPTQGMGNQDGAIRYFMGKNKETPEQYEAWKRARERAKQGHDPADIYADQFWAQEPHTGKWMTEFSDKDAKWIGAPNGQTLGKGEKLGDIYDHPELYKYFPRFKDIPTTKPGFLMWGDGGGYNAPTDPGGEKMMIKGTPPKFDPVTGEKIVGWAGEDFEPRTITGHEVGHAIQDEQGARGGSNPGMYEPAGFDAHRDFINQDHLDKKNVLKAKMPLSEIWEIEKMVELGRDEYSKPTSWNPKAGFGEKWDQMMGDPDVLQYLVSKSEYDAMKDIEKQAHKKYKNKHGEAMARLQGSSERMKLTDDELRNQYPFDPTYFKNITGSNIQDLHDE